MWTKINKLLSSSFNLVIAQAAKAFTFCRQKVNKNRVRCVCFAKNRLHYAKTQKLTFVTLRLKQSAFLRSVPSIFLTLTSQGGNQGIAYGRYVKK